MAQKTNLNISPYYDDFDSEKNFYKVLYKPGFPVQARELTGTQSILQNQIQSFGNNIFKEGSVVIPGNIAYDGQFSAVKLDIENYGIDISLYIKDFIGKKITGRISGIEATLKYIALPGVDAVDDVTIYVTYTSADNNNELNSFTDGEQLVCSDSITYGNTTINAGTPFASLISSGATAIGSAAFIKKGVYFIRGYFVNVSDQTIILDYYSNAPSYRVGLRIDELIVSSKDDSSLYDNAKGFNNFSAPGADRLKINLTLSKKALDDQDDTDFVELLRVKKGKIKILNSKSNYNIVRDWIAERTYDESGNYTVNPFKISVLDSLNDNLGNGGLFYKDEKTDDLNAPSEDMMCVRVSDGKAYVQGYDIDKVGTTIIDVEKPRDVGINSTASVNFNMGSVIRVNNVAGLPKQGALIQFYDGFGQTGEVIGSARAYNLSLRNEEYSDASTVWDLRLFDVQTTTKITLNSNITASELPDSSFVKGKNSGASGYSMGTGDGTAIIKLYQTTGTFAKGEQIEINGVDFPRTIITSTANSTQSIKSLKSTSSNFPDFKADSNLDIFQLPNGISDCMVSNGVSGISTITSGAKQFSGLRPGSTIIYQKGSNGGGDPTYNKVKSIGVGNTNIVVEPITPSIPGVFDGSLPTNATTTSGTIKMNVGAPIIRGSGILHAPLGNRNVSTVDLTNSKLRVTKQLTGRTVTSNKLVVNVSDVSNDYPEITSDATFEPFDEERYSLISSNSNNGTPITITEDAFKYQNSGSTITIEGLSNSVGNVFTASVNKKGIKSKIKNYNKSKMLDVAYSKYERSGDIAIGIGASTVPDGLTYDKRYGVRVQDERISLNYPDVSKFIAVYESIDSERPTLDEFKFSSTANVQLNAILGENIVGYTSKAIARVVNKSSTDLNKLGIVYLTNTRFSEGETVNFDESNIDTNVESITNGTYKDITSSFKLDKGQKDQYYDYSFIIRTRGSSEPSSRLLVIFDYYSITSDDDGDVFTALSYDDDRFKYDIPNIGQSGIRATDTIDLRPRVSVYDSGNTGLPSPFSFGSRSFTIKQYLISNENADLGYEFYLPRIDKVYLNKFGEFVYQKGTSEMDPKPPVRTDDLMELATVNLPPYLYNTQAARLSLIDNRRFTMRDIGNIEDRVSNLEEVTTLSLLENNVQTLQIQDSEGRNRFKTGFFVDPFKNYSSISALSRVQINPQSQELIPIRSRNTLASQVTPKLSTTAETLDFNSNFDLFDGNVQKTGDVVTLKYDEEVWFGQYYATLLKDGSLGVINVNPYELPAILGNVELQPDLDVWTRTIQLEDNVRQTGTNSSVELNLSGSGNIDLGNATTDTSQSEHIRTTDRRIVAGVDSESDTATLQGSTSLSASDSTTISNTDISIQNRLVASASEDHMRSRNTEFKSTGFPANVKTYLYLDGQKIEDITPKLLAICSSVGGEYGATKAFKIGETVSVEDPSTSIEIMKFRVCTPNHKEGPYNNPTEAYSKDPYTNSTISNTSYTLTSPVLNIDTRALAEEAQGEYHGYLVANAKLIGQETGAVAYVKDWDDNKMITDEYGDIIGTFYLRDPNSIPQPSVKVTTGRKNVRITTSSTNVNIAPGTRADIVIAEGVYSAQGTVEEWQNDRTVRVDTTTFTANADFSISAQGSVTSRHTTTRTVEYIDPIAQTFIVGGNVQAPSAIGTNEDLNGLFLTAVEVFFASIDTEVNTPIRCEIRSTTGDARPSRTLMGRSRTLYPFTTDSNGNRIQNIQTDDTNASVGTKFTFPEPIFLPPGQSYAFVLVAERSVAYTVWLGEHGQKAVNSATIPGSTGESPTYSRQYGAGALFKSQNGALWTEDQTQDMKFVLYRAKFTSSTGSVFFNNPNLSESNGYIPQLRNNPIRTLPKTGKIKIPRFQHNPPASNPADQLNTWIKPGRKLVAGTDNTSTAVVDSVGDIADSVSVASTGTNYNPSQSGTVVNTYTIIGNGNGLKLEVDTDVDGYVNNVAINGNNKGSGYKSGDVVGIVTADMGGNKGRDAEISVSSLAPNSMDTIYLTDVQGESTVGGSWKPGGSFVLKYVKDDGTSYAPQANSTNILVDSFSADGGIYDGKTFRVNQFDHSMYSSTNKVEISDIQTDTPSTALTANLLQNETSTISVASTLPFQYFEGIEVNGGTGNIGYVKIGNEIIGYQDANNTGLVIASSTDGRGKDNTIVVPHEIGDKVEKYELGGVSVRRIATIDGTSISNEEIGLDHYYVKIDPSINGSDRSTDKDFNGVKQPELSFKNDSFVGGSEVKASKNIAYSAIVPRYDTMTPSGIDGSFTSITASVRSVSGSSVDGTEVSFNDQGYKDVQLNAYNSFDNVSIVASKINENEYLTNLPRNKSFTTVLNFTSNNEYLSPMVYIGESSTEFISHRLNNPIGSDNYPTDNRVNTTIEDPHSAVYYSNNVRLSKPATSLKILLSAFRPENSDIRVLYRLSRLDSSEVSSEFELFPGYKNLIDNDQDGFGDIVIDGGKNDGRSDSFVGLSVSDEFKEYQYTADNLDLFNGYTIKIVMSGTNQAKPPRIKELRSIAIR
jgi:hypothetical protein